VNQLPLLDNGRPASASRTGASVETQPIDAGLLTGLPKDPANSRKSSKSTFPFGTRSNCCGGRIGSQFEDGVCRLISHVQVAASRRVDIGGE